MTSSSLNAVAVAAHVVVALGLTGRILLTKSRPASALLWIGLVWSFPVLGLIGYALFGRDQLPLSRGASEAMALAARRADAASEAMPEPAAAGPGQPPPRPGNRIELLVDGDAFYPALLEAIDAARTTVHIQSFIIGADAVAGELLARCLEAHARGVRVRILYDRLGSTRAHYSGFFRGARAAGLDIRSLSEVRPLRGRFFVNMRNHRKVAVIDGATGFVGGINLHRDNRRNGARPAAIHDYHARVAGPVVADLQAGFLVDWFRATGDGAPLQSSDAFPRQAAAGPSTARVVVGSPLPDGANLMEAVFSCIVTARHRLTLVTPYFLPDEPTLEAILDASRRGVAVDLIVPRDGNHWYASRAARSLFERLLEAGVRVWLRVPPFLHAKLLVVDERLVMLGSANLDYRSLHINFETNLLIDDARFAARCVEQVAVELEASDEVTLQLVRSAPLLRRLADRACYLLQPLL